MTVLVCVAGVLAAAGPVLLAVYTRPVELTEDELILEDY